MLREREFMKRKKANTNNYLIKIFTLVFFGWIYIYIKNNSKENVTTRVFQVITDFILKDI
jgi:hypothetical protein